MDWLRQKNAVPVDKHKHSRSAPTFDQDLCGQNMRINGAHKAHLIPRSFDCCTEWLCLFLPFVTLALNVPLDERMILCMMMMLGLKIGKNRYPLSGFIHSFLNFIPLPNQEYILDENPSVMFIPVLSAKEILFWNGEPYHCVVIFKHDDFMAPAGFGICKDGLLQGKTTIVNGFQDSEFFCELASDDAAVARAFASFNELLLIVVPLLASKTIACVKSFKVKLCSIFREFLAQISGQEVPCLGVSRGSVIVCLKFGRNREPAFPNFEHETSATAQGGRTAQQDSNDEGDEVG